MCNELFTNDDTHAAIVVPGYRNRNALFKKLYTEYFDRVFHAAFFYTKCKENAEDITQEVFEKLWRKLDSLNLDNIKGYLLVMVRNHYLNRKRKEDNVRHSISDYYKGATFSETHDMMLEKECWSLYVQALDRLPSRQRQVFELKDEGFKSNDIAEMMNITVSTVNNTIYMAMFKIREFVMVNLNVLSAA